LLYCSYERLLLDGNFFLADDVNAFLQILAGIGGLDILLQELAVDGVNIDLVGSLGSIDDVDAVDEAAFKCKHEVGAAFARLNLGRVDVTALADDGNGLACGHLQTVVFDIAET